MYMYRRLTPDHFSLAKLTTVLTFREPSCLNILNWLRCPSYCRSCITRLTSHRHKPEADSWLMDGGLTPGDWGAAKPPAKHPAKPPTVRSGAALDF